MGNAENFTMISILEAANILFRHRKKFSDLLNFYRSPTLVSYGSLSNEELVFLKQLVSQYCKHGRPFIEIGTLFGFSSTLVASWLDPDCILYTVDNYTWNPWGVTAEVQREIVKKVMAPFTQTGRVEIIEQDSEQFLQQYNGAPPSVVFLDGDHSYESVKKEILLAKRIGAKVVSGHDYSSSHPGVLKAVDEHYPMGVNIVGTLWSTAD